MSAENKALEWANLALWLRVLIVGVASTVLFFTALLPRIDNLSSRPMHGDEANQAVKTGILLETGRYVYDPHDHHGPTLYYAAAAVAKLRGQHTLADTDEITFRVVPVIFGLITLALLPLAFDGLGLWGVAWMAALLALSPAFTYYNRYFIQETMLVCFTWLTLAACWRYFRAPGFVWAVLAGTGLGLMHATKETFVLAIAAAAGAAMIMAVLNREAFAARYFSLPKAWPYHLAATGAVTILISVALFTAFFTHARGPLDSILTYGNYLQRADGAGLHDKPWYYYFRVLGYFKEGLGAAWSEWPILLMAMLGGVLAWWPTSSMSRVQGFARFMTLYTLLLAGVYSMIPYKTPWSMLSFYFGFAALSSYAFAALIPPRHNATGIMSAARYLVLVLLVLTFVPMGNQMQRATQEFAADPRNPYVYAHTSSSFLKLVEQMDALQALHETPETFTLYALDQEEDYWPIPWYARKVARAGYFNSPPPNYDADMIVASMKVSRGVYEEVKETHAGPMTHSLRPGVLIHVYVKRHLWDAYMASRQ